MPARLFRFAVLLGLRQSARRARRSIAGFAGVTGGIVLALMQLGFQDALYESAVRIHRVLAGEVVVVPRAFDALPNTGWFERAALAEAGAHPDVTEIRTLMLATVMLRHIASPHVQPLVMLAVDPEAPALDAVRLGADLSLLRLPGRALWDLRAQPRWGDVPGSLARDGTVEIQTALPGLALQVPLTVQGTYALGGSIVTLGTAMIAETTLAHLTGQTRERPTLAVLRLRPGADAAVVAAAIGTRLPPHLVALTREELIAREKRFWRQETPIGFLFDLGALLGLVICAIFVGQVLVQTVEENLPEYAVLRTLDLPDGFFRLAICVSGLLVAAAALVPATLLAMALYRLSIQATGLPLDLTATRVAAIGAVAALTAIGAGLAAGRRLRRADPAALL